jgi:hypothetical protein
MTHPSYIVTATNSTDDRDCDWRASTGQHAFSRALYDYNQFVARGYRAVHIRELGPMVLDRHGTDTEARYSRAHTGCPSIRHQPDGSVVEATP